MIADNRFHDLHHGHNLPPNNLHLPLRAALMAGVLRTQLLSRIKIHFTAEIAM